MNFSVACAGKNLQRHYKTIHLKNVNLAEISLTNRSQTQVCSLFAHRSPALREFHCKFSSVWINIELSLGVEALSFLLAQLTILSRVSEVNHFKWSTWSNETMKSYTFWFDSSANNSLKTGFCLCSSLMSERNIKKQRPTFSRMITGVDVSRWFSENSNENKEHVIEMKIAVGIVSRKSNFAKQFQCCWCH